MTKPRHVPDEQIAPRNNLLNRAIPQAIEQIRKNPGKWYVFAGPFEGKAARIRAYQANTGKRWRSITTQNPDLQFRSWTNPDDRKVYVIASIPAQEQA